MLVKSVLFGGATTRSMEATMLMPAPSVEPRIAATSPGLEFGVLDPNNEILPMQQ